MHKTFIVHTVFEPSAKKHLPFFSCFVKKSFYASWTIDFFLHFKADKVVSLQNLFCALTQFHPFQSILRRSILYSLLVPLMQYDVWCYVMRNDVMMLCYTKWYFVPKTHTDIPILEYTIPLPFIFRLHRLFFGVSALTFRCKFCIPLGTSFELLRLLFRRYRVDFSHFALYFGGIRLFAVSSAFPLERLLSRKLTLGSLRNDFL